MIAIVITVADNIRIHTKCFVERDFCSLYVKYYRGYESDIQVQILSIKLAIIQILRGIDYSMNDGIIQIFFKLIFKKPAVVKYMETNRNKLFGCIVKILITYSRLLSYPFHLHFCCLLAIARKI